MIIRTLLMWGVRSYVRGPAKSWLITSAAVLGLRFAQSAMNRVAMVEKTTIKPGDRFIIEHLEITHAEQITQHRRARRRAKKSRR